MKEVPLFTTGTTSSIAIPDWTGYGDAVIDPTGTIFVTDTQSLWKIPPHQTPTIVATLPTGNPNYYQGSHELDIDAVKAQVREQWQAEYGDEEDEDDAE